VRAGWLTCLLFHTSPVWARQFIVFRNSVRSLSQRYFGLILHSNMQKQRDSGKEKAKGNSRVKVELILK